MNNEFGLKELYDLTLRATYPIHTNNRTFEEGEIVARFDKIQLSNFQEITSRVAARGGYDNRALVFWEDPKEIQLNFTQGIFSKQQFALLSNSKLISSDGAQAILVPGHYIGESDDLGRIYVGKNKISKVFVYNMKTGEKIQPRIINSENGEIIISQIYTDVEVDFYYDYNNTFTQLKIGEKLIQGYLQLEGKTRVKDDITGKTHTAILRIPKLKLVSDLSMRLGREAGPVIANFSAIGVPEGTRGSKKIMEMIFLSDDVDADF